MSAHSSTDFSTFSSRLYVTGALETLTPLRIGTGQSSNVTDPDQPVIKDVLGNPVIPGASLKGALRSHIESLLRALPTNTQYNLTCDLLADKPCISDTNAEAYRDPKQYTPDQRDTEFLVHSCRVCRLFGSNYVAAKMALRDLAVIPEHWGNRYLIRDGVAIDRDKGIAAYQKKYTLEAVPAATRFEFHMQVDNGDDADLGLAMLAVRALKSSHILLGGGRSRGLGWCMLRDVSMVLHNNALDFLLGNPGRVLDETTQKHYVDAFERVARGIE